MLPNLNNINALYDNAAASSVTVIEARSKLVEQFCAYHHIFYRTARQNPDDTLLSELIKLSGRLRYLVLSVPLPINQACLIKTETKNSLIKRISNVGRMYEELHETSKLYAAALTSLLESEENPLWRAISSDFSLKRPIGRVAFLIKPSHLTTAVQEEVKRYGNIVEVITETQLRLSRIYDRLYIFGAGRWYPGFVFSMPRASDLRVVRHAVINDASPDEAVFVKPLRPLKRKYYECTSIPLPNDFSQVEASEVPPKLDIASIVQRARGVDDETSVQFQPTDLIESKLFLLEQELAVFVVASEGASELVVDFQEGEGKPVCRVNTSELEPGMAILVRTEGGGDYIVKAADQIMAERSEELRQRQRYWKHRLRELVNRYGSTQVVERLKVAGSRIANYQNLQNWINFRSIRTYDKADFKAIFKLIGAAAVADQYWESMGVIDAAHRRAGFLIRNQLLQQVKSDNLSPLRINGRQDFVLPGEVGGGSVTAIRIVKIMPEVFDVHPSKTHCLFDAIG